jgi:L-ascorbate metabolism protein UlaG (beta-lactamase superfamily)
VSQPGEPVRVRFVGHATVLIEIGGVRVLTDPFLRQRLGPLTRHGPRPNPDDLGADIVVISHGHADHLDPRSLMMLPNDPVIVAPRGLGLRIWRLTGLEVVEIQDGEVARFGDLQVIAVPARHWISPGAPRAQPLGYVLDAGPRVYFAGDTGPFEGLAGWVGSVDLALLPVWTWGPHVGPGHLNPRSAAALLVELAPSVAIPIHWGTLYPRHLDRVWHRPLREPGDRFAEHAARLAPSVDVRVLRPGDVTELDLGAGWPGPPASRAAGRLPSGDGSAG